LRFGTLTCHAATNYPADQVRVTKTKNGWQMIAHVNFSVPA